MFSSKIYGLNETRPLKILDCIDLVDYDAHQNNLMGFESTNEKIVL